MMWSLPDTRQRFAIFGDADESVRSLEVSGLCCAGSTADLRLSRSCMRGECREVVRYWCTPSLLGHAGTSRCHSGSSAGSPVSYQQPNLMHSVVVPTRNHPHSLSKTLESLASAEHPDGGWEVIVVDNSDEHEKDLTARVVAALHDSHFRYLPTSPRGLMAARHEGTECARGEIVSWIDDDEDVASSWFSGVKECVQRHGAALIAGPFRPDYESPPPPWLDGLWDSSPYGRHLGLLTLCDFGPQERETPHLWCGAGISPYLASSSTR